MYEDADPSDAWNLSPSPWNQLVMPWAMSALPLMAPVLLLVITQPLEARVLMSSNPSFSKGLAKTELVATVATSPIRYLFKFMMPQWYCLLAYNSLRQASALNMSDGNGCVPLAQMTTFNKLQ